MKKKEELAEEELEQLLEKQLTEQPVKCLMKYSASYKRKDKPDP